MTTANGRSVVHPSASGAMNHAVRSAPAADRGELERLVHRMLVLLGEDPDRPGLRETPRRMAEALRRLTGGDALAAEDAIGDAVFESHHDGMVLVRDIEVYSLCEHHLLPFYGRAHVAYIPGGGVVGLSKLARLVDVFARRLQVQERLTDQVAHAIEASLRPAGVAVTMEAHHLCMMMRGVEKQHSSTVTRALRGDFATSDALRDEFMRLALRSG